MVFSDSDATPWACLTGPGFQAQLLGNEETELTEEEKPQEPGLQEEIRKEWNPRAPFRP